eukprot:317851_1
MSSSTQLFMGCYVLLSIFGISALILLGTITHLICVAIRNHQNRFRDNTNSKTVNFIIALTLIGIISFLISLSLIIALLIEIILIDRYDIHYETLKNMECIIVLFDQFGHLAMITIFIIRLKMCFSNSILGYSKRLLRSMYICLLTLTSMSFAIIIQLAHKNRNNYAIIISEILWEIFIEILCLWLLYLFVSKLSDLIVMALGLSELDVIITHLISNRNLTDMSTTGSHNNVSIKNTSKRSSKHKSSISEIVVAHKKMSDPRQKISYNFDTHYDSQIIYLINIITKMSVLVIMAVSGSIISTIGTLFIEIYQLNNYETNLNTIWAFLFPVSDMIITSICLLYLQFNFTQNTYSSMCTKIDVLFLRCVGNALNMVMKRSIDKDNMIPIEAEIHNAEEIEEEQYL